MEMMKETSRRSFIVKTASAGAVVALGGTLVACGDAAVPKSEFNYGLASGDPLSDRVILWTHAKIPLSNESVGLTWQVASDVGFASIVKSGQLKATEASSFTAKVDVTGLSAGTTYFYRFVDDAGVASITGTTRTLPTTSATSVKLAVFSCSLYSAGFFNAYDAAAKSDAQYAIHLGDYLYEYGSDAAKFGNTDAVTSTTAVSLGRVISPANDMVSLSDYRTRFALYRSDVNLQALHAKMPWITVWDDHEFANDAYMTGAENHNPTTQGDWTTRKTIAAKVYHEWMPIRTHASGDQFKIYRSFDFGNLLSLHMLDTRIEGRDQQYGAFGDLDGGVVRYLTGLGTGTESSRRMISTVQQTWLTNSVTASTATWQFLGNQDIMARMWFPGSVLTAFAINPASVPGKISEYLTAKATRAAAPGALSPTQTALLAATKIPYNLDSWDGYPANRESVLQMVKASGKKLVALSGDSHNAWFANLTTLTGEKVGVEFATSSVTAPGFESAGLGDTASSLDGSALVPQLGSAAIGAGLGLVDDLNYSDTTQRGYLLMTVTSAAVKGEFVFVNTVKSKAYTASVGKTITVAAANGAVTYS
jgi:alkaline phosphatase D